MGIKYYDDLLQRIPRAEVAAAAATVRATLLHVLADLGVTDTTGLFCQPMGSYCRGKATSGGRLADKTVVPRAHTASFLHTHFYTSPPQHHSHFHTPPLSITLLVALACAFSHDVAVHPPRNVMS